MTAVSAITATGNATYATAKARSAAATVKVAAVSDATGAPAADTTAMRNARTATAREKFNATTAKAPRSSPAPVAVQKGLSLAPAAAEEATPNGTAPNAVAPVWWMTTNGYRMYKPIKPHSMKQLILLAALCITPMIAMAQSKTTNDTVFIQLNAVDIYGGPSAFATCFTNCDLNGDGLVSYAEAEKATRLILDYGGRKNIISDYSFLKHFPNLVELSIGNTPNESIDLSMNPKLEKINLTNGLWIKEVTLAKGCNPQIIFPIHDSDITFKRVSITPW